VSANLSAQDKREALTMTKGQGWAVFKRFLAETKESMEEHEADLARDLEGLIEREQMFGQKHMLRKLENDFITYLNNEQTIKDHE